MSASQYRLDIENSLRMPSIISTGRQPSLRNLWLKTIGEGVRRTSGRRRKACSNTRSGCRPPSRAPGLRSASFDANEWMETYWGTARNVWGVEFIETVRAGEPDMRLFFYSSKPIFPIIRELSDRFPNVMLELTFADEGEEVVGVAHYACGRGLCKGADWRSERG